MHNILLIKKNFLITNEITNLLKMPDTLIISLDYDSHKQLNAMNITHTISDNYLDDDDKNLINKTALQLITNWYKNEKIEKLITFNGINFGWLLEVELHYNLIDVITTFLSLLKVKEKENPKLVTISNDLFEMATTIFMSSKINTMEITKIKQRFYFDFFPVKYNVGMMPITLGIPRRYFFTLRKYYEKLFISFFNKIFAKIPENKDSIILVDFNPAQYGEFLKCLSEKNTNVLLLNRRRVAIWNFKSFNTVRKTNCIPVTYEQFLNKSDKEEIKKLTFDMTKKLDLLFSDQKLLDDIFSINNHSFWNYLSKYFKNFCKERFEEAIYEMIASRKLLTNLKPSLILHFYEVALQEKILIFEARKQNIPSILIQHGTPFLSYPDFHLLNSILGILPLYQDKKIACWGSMVKDYAMKQGMDENNVIVSGSIKHDDMFRMKQKQYEKKGTILIALGQLTSFKLESQSITTYERYEKCLRIICNALKKIPGRKKIAKLHPGEMVFRTVAVEPIIREIDPSIDIVVDADLGKLLQSADVIISIGLTTVLLEANIFEKPTITLVADRLEFLSILSNGYTELFTDEEEDRFQKFLIDILADDKLRNEQIKKGLNFVSAYMANPGRASEYLVQKIEHMVPSKTPSNT